MLIPWGLKFVLSQVYAICQSLSWKVIIFNFVVNKYLMGDIIKNFVNGLFLIILHFSFRIERVITMMIAKWKSSNSIIIFTFISCKSFPFSFVCLSVWTSEFLFYSMGCDQLLSLVCSNLVSGNPFNLTLMSFWNVHYSLNMSFWHKIFPAPLLELVISSRSPGSF